MKGLEEFITEQVEPCFIGSFEVEGNINEVKVGNFKGGKYLLYVHVWENDPGNIPHFHVHDIDYNIDTCVMIIENRYFSHGSHIGTLNQKQRKALNEFLKESSELFELYTNYNTIIRIWNGNNSGKKIDKNLKQPNYTTISEYKK